MRQLHHGQKRHVLEVRHLRVDDGVFVTQALSRRRRRLKGQPSWPGLYQGPSTPFRRFRPDRLAAGARKPALKHDRVDGRDKPAMTV